MAPLSTDTSGVTLAAAARRFRVHRHDQLRDRAPLAVMLVLLLALQLPISAPALFQSSPTTSPTAAPVTHAPVPVVTAATAATVAAAAAVEPPSGNGWVEWARSRPKKGPTALAQAEAAAAQVAAAAAAATAAEAAAKNAAVFRRDLDDLDSPTNRTLAILAALSSKNVPALSTALLLVLLGVIWAGLLAGLRAFAPVVVHGIYSSVALVLLYGLAVAPDSNATMWILLLMVVVLVFWFNAHAAVVTLRKVATVVLDRPALLAAAFFNGLTMQALFWAAVPTADEVVTMPLAALARAAQAFLLIYLVDMHTRDTVAARLVAAAAAAAKPDAADSASPLATKLTVTLLSAGDTVPFSAAWLTTQLQIVATSVSASLGTSAAGVMLAPIAAVGALAVGYLFFGLVLATLGSLSMFLVFIFAEDETKRAMVGVTSMDVTLAGWLYYGRTAGLLVAFTTLVRLGKLRLQKLIGAMRFAVPVAGLAGLGYLDSIAVASEVYEKVRTRSYMVVATLYAVGAVSTITATLLYHPKLLGLGPAGLQTLVLDGSIRLLIMIVLLNWALVTYLDNLARVVHTADAILGVPVTVGDANGDLPAPVVRVSPTQQFRSDSDDERPPHVAGVPDRSDTKTAGNDTKTAGNDTKTAGNHGETAHAANATSVASGPPEITALPGPDPKTAGLPVNGPESAATATSVIVTPTTPPTSPTSTKRLRTNKAASGVARRRPVATVAAST